MVTQMLPITRYLHHYFFVIGVGILIGLFSQPGYAREQAAFDHAWVRMDESSHSPVEIRFIPGSGIPVNRFWAAYRQAFSLSDDNDFVLLRTTQDNLGQWHYRYRQFYKGVEVDAAQFILHEQQGNIVYANGHLVHGLNTGVTPLLPETVALQHALAFIGAQEYMWENPEREAFLKKEQQDPAATFYPSGKLMLTAAGKEMKAENVRLAYRFDIYAAQPFARYFVYVDANTGEVIHTIDRIETGDVPGSGQSLYNGTVDIIIDSFAGGFRLHEADRGGGMQTFDMQNSTNYSTAVDFVDSDTSFTDPNARAGVSAHWGAEATYDFYWNTFGRNSYDDSGSVMLSYVHYGSAFNNAFWDGTRMTYGDGDGLAFTPLVSLDVCGHELTHGVTQFSAGLIYQAESGALNESFSDIFGTMVEYFEEGANFDWAIGEDITPNGNGIRSMENPNAFGDPDTYFGNFWASLSGGDNGGVHTNSGVQNFWFYLLSEGGSGVNDNGDSYNVTGIGIDNAAAVAYRNLTVYLTPPSPYFDARLGAVNAAMDLFGANSPEVQSVFDAWDAVGVYYPRFGPAVAVDSRRLEFLAESSVNSDTSQLIIFNMGLQPLVISDIQVPGNDYSVETPGNFPLTLNAFQESDTISVIFSPTQPGSHIDTLRIISNDTINPTFSVVLDGFGFQIIPAQNGVLYGLTNGQSDNRLLNIDIQNGQGTLIGQTGFENIHGMAVNPVSGVIYATANNSVGSTSLLRVNSQQGDAYVTAEMPQFNLRALTFDRDGTPYTARFTNGELFTVDMATGELTSIGQTTIPLLSGLSINPLNGELWGISLVNKLYKIDKTNGQSTLVGNPGFSRTPDIVFDDQGNLYGLAGGENDVSELISIDTTTGAGTVIGSVGVVGVAGLAIKTAPVVGINDPVAEVVPRTTELLQNYPNPFNPLTIVNYQLSIDNWVTLKVYDLLGRKVKTLVNERKAAGSYTVKWDGRDDAGRPLASGVYVYRLKAGSFVAVRKMMLLK